MILGFDFFKSNQIIFNCNDYTLKIKDTIMELNSSNTSQTSQINYVNVPTLNNTCTNNGHNIQEHTQTKHNSQKIS